MYTDIKMQYICASCQNGGFQNRPSKHLQNAVNQYQEQHAFSSNVNDISERVELKVPRMEYKIQTEMLAEKEASENIYHENMYSKLAERGVKRETESTFVHWGSSLGVDNHKKA